MNGTSGFQEVQVFTPRSQSYRFLHEQRPQFGTGSWHFLRTHELIALSTDISSKREKVPATIFMLFSVCSTSILVILVGLMGCTNLRYAQMDCAVLQGEAARMCQEYRQRKADADIRAAAAELVQAYNKCWERYPNNPDAVKRNCSIYSEPLKDLGLKPFELK
jgi:hypothetical protein